MTISLAFSAIIYTVTTREVYRFAGEQRRKFQERLEEGSIIAQQRPFHMPNIVVLDESELISEVNRRTLISLFIINGAIFICSGILGYILAGKTLKPIQDMVLEQNRFISDASHELKTPLTALKSSFEVFLRDKQPSLTEAGDLVQDSLMEVNKMQKLSEGLLKLAYCKNQNEKIETEKVNIRTNINQSLKIIVPLAKKKTISIKKKISDLHVLAIAERLFEVWITLLDNAIKYSPEKSEISIDSAISGRWIVVKITDQGIGINKTDFKHIFDRFYRADKARSKSSPDGFGLGLSIAKKIVESFNGSITVESKNNKGATFTVKLPKA